MKISGHGARSLPAADAGGGAGAKKGSWMVIAFILAGLILVSALVLIVPYGTGAVKGGLFSLLVSSLTAGGGTTTTGGPNYSLYNPQIQGGSANISYPSDYSTLVAYALAQINQDRANAGLAPVNLSASMAGQQHADSMLRYGYLSHFDTQGFKPYMRYSLLGGSGGVEENVAYIYDSPPLFTTSSSVETGIHDLEHSMIYNDSTCCQNGHKYNILNPLHNRVSIGVAYNSTDVYFVEDFENYYINLDFSISNSNLVSMTGTPLQEGINAKSVLIFYDPTPQPETVSALINGPHEYDPGSPAGGVLPPCSVFCSQFSQGTTVYANTWVFSSTHVDITFSFQSFVTDEGAGVYTIYLMTGSDTSTAITSISVFVTKA